MVGLAPFHFDLGFAGPLLVDPLVTVGVAVPNAPPLLLPVTVPQNLPFGTTVLTQFFAQSGPTVFASNAVVTTVR